MPFDWLMLAFFTLLGGCVGSFLNVVIFRLPEGRSIVSPPSACPRCGARLKWFDNIPVLSWLALGGKCRRCKAPISIQYPIIEAVTALLFGGFYYICYFTTMRGDFAAAGFAETWPVFVVYLALLAGLLACVIIDAKFYIIPLQVTWLIAIVAVVVLPMHAWLIRFRRWTLRTRGAGAASGR